VFINAEELAVIATVDDNVLDDSDYDVWGEMQPVLVESIGQKIDQAVLFGTDAPATFENSISEAAIAKDNFVTLGTTADLVDQDRDDIAGYINAAMGKVEEDGYMVNGAVARLGVKAKLRGLRDEDGAPIFSTSLR